MVVRAIDVGYGNVKYSSAHQNGMVFRHFPSVTPILKGAGFGGDILQRKDLRTICINNVHYQVGPDADMAVKHGKGRVLSQDYIERDTYMALVRGALSYIGDPEIDLLVTGLPVSFYRQHRERLASLLAQSHACDEGKYVNVNKVCVLPQPVGGFLHYANVSGQYHSLRNVNCLVIDVGFYSVDWLVCRGLKTIDERCGSTDLGMSRFLEALADVVGKENNEPFDDINALDAALNGSCALDWYGDAIDLQPLISRVEFLPDEACENIANSVGTLRDIHTVIMVGGGAKYYINSVKKFCRNHSVVEPLAQLLANVKGFQIAGEQMVKSNGG